MNILMVAGGESLFVGWVCIYSYVNPVINYLVRKAERPKHQKPLWVRLIGEKNMSRLISFLTKLFARQRTSYPYTVAPHEIPHLDKVLYNSVGGTNIENIPGALEEDSLSILKSSDYVAVRDSCTHGIL